MSDLQHPVITAVERYGYPNPQTAIYTCSWCDEPIYDGEECFDLSPYGWCCQQCMDARLTVAGDYDG